MLNSYDLINTLLDRFSMDERADLLDGWFMHVHSTLVSLIEPNRSAVDDWKSILIEFSLSIHRFSFVLLQLYINYSAGAAMFIIYI